MLLIKNPSDNAGDIRDRASISGQEIPLEEGMATRFSILAWRFPWRSLAGHSPQGHKESDTTKAT